LFNTPKWIQQRSQGPRPSKQIKHPGCRGARRGGLLEAEFVGPGHNRPKQQLVIGEDHQKHCQDGVADGGEILLLDSQRHIGAMPGSVTVVFPTVIDFRRHHKEPAAGHRHHRIPDQARHGEGHIEPPESAASR